MKASPTFESSVQFNAKRGQYQFITYSKNWAHFSEVHARFNGAQYMLYLLFLLDIISDEQTRSAARVLHNVVFNSGAQ